MAPPIPAPLHDVPGAAVHAHTLRRWLLQDGLAELPEEHVALAEHPFGLRLDLRRLNHPWTEVFLSQHTAVGLGTWATWTGPDGPGHAFAPPGVAWALSPTLFELMRRLRGDEIELHYALAGRFPLLPRGTWIHPDGWWDDWKSRPTDDGTLGDVYRARLYPQVRDLLRDLRPHHIVDVCAGDGELASLLQQDHPAAKLTLIERNAASSDAARALGHHVHTQDAATPWPVHDVNAAVLVGAIQGNVMSPDAALTTLTHLHTALRPGGLAVITGWSPCLVDSHDLRRLGFQVLNAATPPTDDDPNPRQLYVVRKS